MAQIFDKPAGAVSRPFNVFLNIYFVVVFGGIGGLQMYGVNAGFVTNYGADLLAPPFLYLLSRRGSRRGRLRLLPLTALLLTFVGCFLWEWLQHYDLQGTPLAITRGAFDPLDILAYALGLIVCYGVDVRWLQPRGILPSLRAA